MRERDLRQSLPLHRFPASYIWPGVLRVDGLVRHPLELTPADLAALPERTLIADFSCLEGWTVPAVVWRGVPLETVLEQAEIDPAARWVQVSAWDISVPLPLSAVDRALLAMHLGDAPLAPAHGGPVRLVVPGGQCYTSIKWVERLEVRREPAANTARAAALARFR
jgi:DMSO/TMAO reductase YedYZ molybdopterin-dependent catalytic subunit